MIVCVCVIVCVCMIVCVCVYDCVCVCVCVCDCGGDDQSAVFAVAARKTNHITRGNCSLSCVS